NDNSRVALIELPYKMLEPYDEKLSRTVLRGERGCKASDLPDLPNKRRKCYEEIIIFFNIVSFSFGC
ncbi:MAG: hypothetical protein U9R02_09990, partial [Thermodesulfobacteriota bacterium]|nr:hypothetical protein [Thermodesulfobacteriota bacterium]